MYQILGILFATHLPVLPHTYLAIK